MLTRWFFKKNKKGHEEEYNIHIPPLIPIAVLPKKCEMCNNVLLHIQKQKKNNCCLNINS